jgi:hypothetical protein
MSIGNLLSIHAIVGVNFEVTSFDIAAKKPITGLRIIRIFKKTTCSFCVL